MTDTSRKEFPAFGRDDLIKQMIGMRSRYQSYKAYAEAPMDSMLTKEQLKGALVYRANNLRSGFVRNEGNGRFVFEALPMQAQLSMLCGMIAEDFDGDGNLDIAINGNDYGTEVLTGRYDALNGLVLKGDGKGKFQPLKILQSGFYVPGNGKALVKLRGENGRVLFAATQNRGPLKMFLMKGIGQIVSLEPGDMNMLYRYKNGSSQKQECYFGNSFLSQSSRFCIAGQNVESVTITDIKGNVRKVDLK